jgi:dephospho-CoA kinase
MEEYGSLFGGQNLLSPGTVPTIIAIVGLAGAGKSEAVALLTAKYDHQRVYFGGVVVNEVKRRGLAVNPENERLVREELRANEGMGAIARRSLSDIRRQIDSGNRVVIDGLYSTPELSVLRENLRSDLVTVAVHCPRWLRKERLSTRSVRPLTSAQVDERDYFEVSRLDKAVPIVLADLHVVNDGSVEELAAKLYESIESLARGE